MKINLFKDLQKNTYLFLLRLLNHTERNIIKLIVNTRIIFSVK